MASVDPAGHCGYIYVEAEDADELRKLVASMMNSSCCWLACPLACPLTLFSLLSALKEIEIQGRTSKHRESLAEETDGSERYM